MTTFTAGSAERLKVLDFGTCYPSGTVLHLSVAGYWSADWSGHTKTWDYWIISAATLSALAAAETAVLAGGTDYIHHGTYAGTSDTTAGDNLGLFGGNVLMTALTTTSRYVGLLVKPQFSAVVWYTNGGTTMAMGSTGPTMSPVTCPVVAPVADFSASPTSGVIGQTITFSDESTNTPASWAWTFGDGGTSTLQNPTHVYAAAGDYNVTLTATNSGGSDAETKTSYISILVVGDYEPAEPSGVLLEIYAASPGSSRWGVAQWGVGKWSTAGWQDVTPQGVNVRITWGSDEPELGILSTPQPASWAVDYYDPDRILDPSNTESPYYGDLIPFLPIRVSHRGTVIRVGYATGIQHDFEVRADFGYMRGADNISRLANAKVPSDTMLADTLYARTVDAIAAAGLTVTVAAPVGADPAVSPWVTGTRDWSVWQWITDAAQETLRIPIIDRLGTLTFRAWDSPLYRARSVDATEMVGLQVITDYSGLYSVVQARMDEDTIVERALVPPPRYGARTYKRDEITIDPEGWAEAVLADRTFPVLRWEPGAIRPLTANRVETLATIEAVERIGIALSGENPAVTEAGIVVGGEITIRGKLGDAAIWSFRLFTAQTSRTPLIETGGEPTDYLLRTGGGEYVYPTGGA